MVSAAMVALRVCGAVCAAVVMREPVSMPWLRGWFCGGLPHPDGCSTHAPAHPATLARDSLTLSLTPFAPAGFGVAAGIQRAAVTLRSGEDLADAGFFGGGQGGGFFSHFRWDWRRL